MEILGTIFVGFMVGLLARLLRPGPDKMGLILTTLVGIGGAVVGGYLGQLIGIYRVGEPAGFLGSILGSILVLVVLDLVFRRRRRI